VDSVAFVGKDDAIIRQNGIGRAAILINGVLGAVLGRKNFSSAILEDLDDRCAPVLAAFSIKGPSRFELHLLVISLTKHERTHIGSWRRE
jgi:hypothetical protein